MRVRILYQKDWKQEYSIQSFNHHWSPNMYLQGAMNLVVNQTPSSLPWSCQLDVEKQGKLPKEVHLCIHGVKHSSPWVLARALLLTDCVIKFLQASIEWGHSIRTIGCWLKFSKAFLLSLNVPDFIKGFPPFCVFPRRSSPGWQWHQMQGYVTWQLC